MYLSIDIGGTKTLIALFSRYGRVLKKLKFKTALSIEDFKADLIKNLGDFQKFSQIKVVVVAIPGVVQKNYSVRFGNRDWGEVNLLDTIKSLFNCPIFFENDANLAALYEARGTRGRTIFLTFSTGIGGGIIEKNKILKPESDQFEPGHKIYDYDGKKSEWEDIAAASAIEKAFHVQYATDLRGNDIMKKIAERVYLGIPDIIKEYHPKTIVLGGPLGKIFKLYRKFMPDTPEVKFKRPKRPTESVIYGCYFFGRSQK